MTASRRRPSGSPWQPRPRERTRRGSPVGDQPLAPRAHAPWNSGRTRLHRHSGHVRRRPPDQARTSRDAGRHWFDTRARQPLLTAVLVLLRRRVRLRRLTTRRGDSARSRRLPSLVGRRPVRRQPSEPRRGVPGTSRRRGTPCMWTAGRRDPAAATRASAGTKKDTAPRCHAGNPAGDEAHCDGKRPAPGAARDGAIPGGLRHVRTMRGPRWGALTSMPLRRRLCRGRHRRGRRRRGGRRGRLWTRRRRRG